MLRHKSHHLANVDSNIVSRKERCSLWTPTVQIKSVFVTMSLVANVYPHELFRLMQRRRYT